MSTQDSSYKASIEGLGKKGDTYTFLVGLGDSFKGQLKSGDMISVEDVPVSVRQFEDNLFSFELSLKDVLDTKLVQVEIGSEVFVKFPGDSQKSHQGLLGLTLAVLLLAAPAFSRAEERLRVGVIAPLSGVFAKYGEMVRQGVSEGAGDKVDLIFEDEGCDPARAVSAYRKLTDIDKIQYVVGPCCGSPQNAIAHLVKKHQQILMLPNSAAQSLHDLASGNVYSAQYAIESESRFNAEQMFARGVKTVVVVFTESEFARSHEKAFVDAYKGKVLESLAMPALDAALIKSAALRIKALQPDAIYVPDASPFFGGLLTEMRKLGITSAKVFSVYSAQSPDVLTAEGPNAEGLFYSYPDIAEADAVSWFARLAGRLLSDAVVNCAGEYACVKKTIDESKNFKADGSLAGNIVLKMVQNGSFVRVPQGD